MAAPPPIVTLLTDFGAGSGYPAQMKGVLLGLLPEVRLVDLSHAVPPFDVLAGALLLEACVPRFPPHAVHCAVVDPGVGTARRPLGVVAPDGRRLVGPDNGLLTPFLGAGARAFHLADRERVPEPASATFHGRDLFAPVAAWLAGGGAMDRLGPEVRDPVVLPWSAPARGERELRGATLAADSFGNLLTDIPAADLPSGPLAVEVDGRPVRFVRTYGDAAVEELVALVGSSGRLEIAARLARAEDQLGRARGVPVTVRRGG